MATELKERSEKTQEYQEAKQNHAVENTREKINDLKQITEFKDYIEEGGDRRGFF